MNRHLRFAAVALAWMALLPSAWAFRVSPMIVNFAPAGSGTTQTFVLENTGQDKIAVQIEATRRVIDADGKETRPSTNDFSIYPQQLSLQPSEKRNLRVTWTGTRQPDRELSYRLVVTELPIELKKPSERTKKAGANLTFLMQYVASLYVTPPGAAPRIVVDSFKLVHGQAAELVLKNTGLAHKVLKGIHVFAKTKTGPRTEIKNAAVENMQGENILALGSRRFKLEIPASLAHQAQPGALQAEIEFK